MLFTFSDSTTRHRIGPSDCDWLRHNFPIRFQSTATRGRWRRRSSRFSRHFTILNRSRPVIGRLMLQQLGEFPLRPIRFLIAHGRIGTSEQWRRAVGTLRVSHTRMTRISAVTRDRVRNAHWRHWLLTDCRICRCHWTWKSIEDYCRLR